MTVQETTHRGIRWQRHDDGRLQFYDPDGARWVTWGPKVDAPPPPPDWAPRRAAGGIERPPWRSRWRLIPIVFIAAVVVIAVVQALRPSGHQANAEAKASAALLGKCLAQHGVSGGHQQYTATPVPCDSPTAAVRVAEVIPSTPGSPICPPGTTGMVLPYPGVRYLHVLCIEPVRAGG
jgi:hypothetical protein